MSKKNIIIGIDGVPFRLIEDLSNRGVMPNFQELKKEGVFRKMRSAIPHVSSVAWSSIITGKNPGEHGIFGFTELLPDNYNLAFPDFNWLKELPFWQKDKNKKYVILNVPSTYPVKGLNGVHISGFVSPDLEKAVFPKKYLPKLKEIGYQTDVDSSIAHKSKSLFLERLFEALEARIAAYRFFWEKEDWDVFMLVFTGSDRLEHFLWSSYEDENEQYHQDFLNYFKRVDEIIGEISDRINDDDSLLILSDHGMERIKANVNINYFLQTTGFLTLDKSQKSYNQITEETKAFALDPARIYLNKKPKYSRGSVEKKDEEKIIQQLIQAFSELEVNSEKAIKEIYRKEEIYRGSEIDRAPDLVLIENSGFRLRGSINKDTLFEKDIFTGHHTLEDAFLYIKDKSHERISPDDLKVEDVVTILNKI